MSERTHEHPKPEVPRVPPDTTHWLVRPTTIRKLWMAMLAILALLVLADFFIEPHPYFGFDGIPGYSAVLGLVVGFLWLTVSKLVGIFIKRPDTYYDQ